MTDFLHKKSEAFLEYLQTRNYSERTLKTYRENLHEALRYVEVIVENEGTIIDLMPYRLHLASRKKRTVYKKISIFRSFVSYLADRGEVIRLRNDMSVKLPKTLPKPVETAHIFEALQRCTSEEKILVELVYGLGLRISELCGLQVKDIENGWVRVKGKGDKIRRLPLPDRVAETVMEHIRQADPRVYLFEKSGSRMTENQIRYRIEKIFKKIGMKVTPHQLRHAFATDLLNRGARITDVSILLGHASLETTQIYTRLNDRAKLRNYQKAHPLCGEYDGYTTDD